MLRKRAKTAAGDSRSLPAISNAQLYISELGMTPKSRFISRKKVETLKSLPETLALRWKN
jgi:hypothetical protein